MDPLQRSSVIAAVAVAVAVAPVRSVAQSAPSRATVDTAAVLASARGEIAAANAAWLPGLRRHDAAMIAAAYADSGIFVAADGTITAGREAVERLYEARFARLGEILSGGVVQDGVTVASRDRIYEWGHAWLLIRDPKVAAPVRSGGGYFTVWQRGADGRWRISRNLVFRGS